MSTKAHKNVTLSLPEPLLRRFKVYAASRDQSMTQLMTRALRTMMDRDCEVERAKCRTIERMRSSPSRGTGGVITWTREEIHERVR